MLDVKMVTVVEILRMKMVTVMEILGMKMVTMMEIGMKGETKNKN